LQQDEKKKQELQGESPRKKKKGNLFPGRKGAQKGAGDTLSGKEGVGPKGENAEHYVKCSMVEERGGRVGVAGGKRWFEGNKEKD